MDFAESNNISEKRLFKILLQLQRKDYWNYGVSLRAGWIENLEGLKKEKITVVK